MSKAHQRPIVRHHGLSLFGKDLVRRCSAHCELCDAQGVKLSVYEVPPLAALPDFEHCLMLCDTCLKQIKRPKLRDPNHWRCLNHAVWSTIPAVQVLALVILHHLSESERWALKLEEQVYIEPKVQEWLEQVELP